METLLSICIGIGLSAACGFRVFVPLLVVSVAGHSGHLQLASGFDWLASSPAMIAFAVATCLEIAGYYIPWVDNLLDTMATPAAVVAGTIITASLVTDMSPFMKWTLALIAGGGAAATVQGATVLTRGASSAATGGLANPIVATLELIGSVIVSALSILVPILAVTLVLALLAFLAWKVLRRTRVATLQT